ncbi:hypothetical protein CKK33_00165 [Mucilaginibacter sp. MD40]|uniref:lysophospholipid acyltransferase family protein n=1 Tax=Mucilaginibacter sp. MD40 TaxID=2029590 RepID=UPI000BAC7156|nr:lysophospholipid acyltransferase family protein [Mucilaginibacter sp. MD40]PAW91991.1 hypothetical protein CKK33_00165 [Mucilaginibacter sp. MD40]
MIYPKKNRFITWFFHHYILRIVERNFYAVNYDKLQIDPERSVLLLANHFSWWDGFLMYYLNHRLFGKRFHVMVIEETAKKVGFFKYMGAFSVKKGSREILQSLNFAAEMLQDPDNLVLIFPQGKLYSNFTDEVHFEKGLSHILKNAGDNYQTVLSATFVENFEHKKPVANVYLKTIDAGGDISDLKAAYKAHYINAHQQQTQISI